MTGRSLWSVLMVAWLSAGGASIVSYDSAVADIAVSEPGHEGDGVALIESTDTANPGSSVADPPTATGPR